MNDNASAFNLTTNPLWDLPRTDPRCMNTSCFAWVIGYIEEQERYPNREFPLYGHWATYFYCATVFVFAATYLNRRLADGSSGTRLKDRTIACWRKWAYRRIRGRLGNHVDISWGQLSLFVAASIFIAVLPFFQGYYLRSQFRFGSPPLSVRCAILISALLPINIALAGKVNIVSLLTGVSYAKLNVWHRYISFVIFALSVVHTVPHFISPIKDSGFAGFVLMLKEKRRELSGIVLQFVFTIMLITALPWVRNRMYELFKILHVIFAIMFFGFLLWHVYGEADVIYYYWATLAVLVGNFVSRVIYRNRATSSLRDFMHGFPTTLEVLPGDMTRVVIQCPSKLQWKPGQHCYLSIPGISRLQAHPFTIVSLSSSQNNLGPNDLVLLVRACKGFTRLLSDVALKSSRSGSVSSVNTWSVAADADVQISSRSWVDGPYGDFHPSLERQYQGVVCVAGGSGITSSLPWLVYLAKKMRTAAQGSKGIHGEKTCKTRNLHLIWSVKKISWIRWAERELSEALREVMEANAPTVRRGLEKFRDVSRRPSTYKLTISIFITSPVSDDDRKSAVIDLFLGAGIDVYNPHARVEIFAGRPNYVQMLPNRLDRKKNIVMTCGPQSQKIDVANSVATLQSMVMRDQTQQISLHSETFGW